ncbi:DUF1707 domain-containing protein [Nocardioides sp. JQ2195]|nr:DUF1707 domain-containing protein [Nocardioides sp. JQ2195]
MVLGRRGRPSRRQRSQALDALSAAHADGQLDRAEHEGLMTEVMVAEDVDDLRAALADLQLPSDHPAQRLLAPGARTRRALDRVLMGAGTILLLLIGAALFVTVVEDGPDPWPEPVAMMEEPAVDRAFSEIREELGTTEVIAADIRESRVDFQLPDDTGAGRYTSWHWDGHELRESGPGAMDVARPKVADLEDVDLTRLFANLGRAVRMLKGQGEVSTDITINGGSWPSVLNIEDHPDTPGSPPHVEIVVRTANSGDSATLVTDLSGREVLLRSPSLHDPDLDE